MCYGKFGVRFIYMWITSKQFVSDDADAKQVQEDICETKDEMRLQRSFRHSAAGRIVQR